MMHVVLVHIHVKPEFLDAFRAATIENAQHSLQEPGIARFDFIQSADDPARFTLIEVYRTPTDADAHKTTAHYLKWRDMVAEMMAEPRQGVKYRSLYPPPEQW
jgi:(4S)-4-hydroxy-5-phosphonooxypentane-2,3-dione isomerase